MGLTDGGLLGCWAGWADRTDLLGRLFRRGTAVGCKSIVGVN